MCFFCALLLLILCSLSLLSVEYLTFFGICFCLVFQISGAVIEISEPKSSRGDRVAHISGTPEQKRSAENLIQAFIMAT